MIEETPPEIRGKLPPEWQEEVKECFQTTAPKIYRFLRRFTQGDQELTAVLVQETFKEAARKQNWSELRARTAPRREAWLIRVAQNIAIDAFRSAETERQKRQQVSIRYWTGESNVHEEAMTSIAVEHFIKVLHELPPQQARVAFLYWRCGWTNREIAEALGITPGCVSQHTKKAMAALKRELRPYVPFDLPELEGGAAHEQ